MSINTGLILFFVRKLEPDWNIFTVLDGSLQISSQRPWKVLLLLDVIGGSEYSLGWENPCDWE